ncbi:translation initiation factor IF-2-like isoform X2 [Molothrus ater]|nr:translation initiation factor IF-2-like isoform X2 [Molothrus ater]
MPRPAMRSSAGPPPPGPLRAGCGTAGSAADSGAGGAAPAFGSAWCGLWPGPGPERSPSRGSARLPPRPRQRRRCCPRSELRHSSARPPAPGTARQGAAAGAVGCPGQNGESAVPPSRAEKAPLEQLCREGGGGCGSVYSGTRLADCAPP